MDEIKFDKKNYRKHSDDNKRMIRKSLDECGAGRSIVIDAEGEIIAGNGVYEQAKKKGMPVRVVETDGSELVVVKRTDLATDDEKRRLLAMADNAASDNVEWDMDALTADFDGCELGEWGIDCEIEQDDETTGEAKDDDFDDTRDEIETRCQKGDIWQLGEHRLMCGDSTSQTDVAELMDGHKADIAFTSPPYNMGNDVGKAVERSKNLRMTYIGKDGAYNEYSDSLSDADYSKLLNNALDAALANADDVLFNIGILAGSKFGIIDMMHQHIDKFCDILVWKKKNCIPMGMQDGLIAHLCEFVFCFNKNGNRAFKHPQWKKCVFDGAMMTNVIETKNQCNNEYSKVHHATFPVEFASEVIRRFSKESVLDQFGGTGTTLIACEQLKRKCFMMELDPHYCDVILARWEKLTGKQATKI